MRIDAGINWATFGTSLAAANFVVAMMAYASRESTRDLGQFVWLLLFGCWAVSPHVPLGCFSLSVLYRKQFDRVRDALLLLGSILIGVGGFVVYVDAIFIHLDLQSGLAFIVVPVLQWLAVIVTTGVAAVVSVCRRRRPANCAD